MKSICCAIPLLLVLLFLSNDAYAQLDGTTTISMSYRGAVVPVQPPVSNRVEVSVTDCLSAIYRLYETVKAAITAIVTQNYLSGAYYSWQAYNEMNNVTDDCGDAVGIRKIEYTVPPAFQEWDFLQLEFDVMSRGDRTWNIDCIAPSFLRASVTRSESHHKTVVLKIRPTDFPCDHPFPADIPIVFRDKEDDCNMCCTVEHVIFLRFTQNPFTPSADLNTKCSEVWCSFDASIAKHKARLQELQAALSPMIRAFVMNIAAADVRNADSKDAAGCSGPEPQFSMCVRRRARERNQRLKAEWQRTAGPVLREIDVENEAILRLTKELGPTLAGMKCCDSRVHWVPSSAVPCTKTQAPRTPVLKVPKTIKNQ